MKDKNTRKNCGGIKIKPIPKPSAKPTKDVAKEEKK